LVPPRVVLATCPPENCPRATSNVLVMTRVPRTASCGKLAPPKLRPSRVVLFWLARWPATLNPLAVLSLPPWVMTPAVRAAMAFGSLASTGRRSACSVLTLRSVLPGSGRPWPAPGAGAGRATTRTSASCVATCPSFTSATRRSSSPSRWTATVRGWLPMARTVTR
jgi:hypothetical protein